MSDGRWQQLKEIFYQALDESPEARAAFLDSACAHDLALRREIEELLAFHEKSGGFIDEPLFNAVSKVAGGREGIASLVEESTPDAEDWPGTERFSVERQLGAGGFGVVYAAYDRERKIPVAIKVLYKTSAAALYRFKREFRALTGVSHTNLVALYELMSDSDRWFFTMELVDGCDFLTYIKRDTGALPFDLARLRGAFLQLSEGVYALHRTGKLHRDIKPSNVMVTKEGRVVLLDFGLITDIASDSSEHSFDLVGTPAYMSPEQAAGLSVTAASDWYSVGIILYKALTGRLPFEGSFIEIITAKQAGEPLPPAELVPGLPDDLNQLCIDLLRREPEARPGGKEILERLGSLPRAPEPAPSYGLSGRLIPFVGREQQLELLKQAFAQTGEGDAVAVFVHGPSGIGKSALIRRFLDDLHRREEGAVVLAGRCYESETVPYKAMDSLIDALSKYLKRLPAHNAELLMPRDVMALARLFPVLRQVEAAAKGPQRKLEVADSRELRRRAFAALREMLIRLSDRARLVLFIDDLQWGDVDSAALLAELMRPPDPPSLMLVASYRSDEAQTSPMLQMLLPAINKFALAVTVRSLNLAELDAEEARNLALTLLGEDDSFTQELARVIATESGGHPFFINELVQYLQASGAEQFADISLESVLHARIARLPQAARRLLEVVAVASRPIDSKTARRAAGIDSDDLSSKSLLRMEKLIRIRETKDREELEAYHDRIRETVLAQLCAQTLRQYHYQLALALEDAGNADPETLSQHFAAGGEPRLAAEYALAAAEQATKALAFNQAARLYRLILELGGDSIDAREVRVKLANTLVKAGRGTEAADLYLSALEGANPAESLELQRRAAEQLLRSGHIDRGLKVIHSVLGKMGMKLASTPTRALISLLVRRAQVWLKGLHYRERDATQISIEDQIKIDACLTVSVGLSFVDTIRGADFQALHLLLALKAGEPYRVARAFALEATYSAIPGIRNHKRTEKFVEASFAISRRIDNPHALALSLLTAGAAAFLEGYWQRSSELSRQAEILLREKCMGVAWELDMAIIFQMRSLYWLGGVGEIAERLPIFYKDAQERGDLYATANITTRIAYIALLAADDADRARQEITSALSHWSARGFQAQHYFGMVSQVEIDLYCGDNHAAWQRVTERWPKLRRSLFLKVQHLLIESLFLRARAALAMASADSARQTYLDVAAQDARSIAKERAPWSEPVALLVQAAIAATNRDSARALALLARAEAGFTAVDMALFAAVARRRRGQLLGGDAGAELSRAVDEWMSAKGIRNIDRMTNMLAPGRW